MGISEWLDRIQEAMKNTQAESPKRCPLGNRSFESLEDRSVMAGGIVANFALTQDWGSGFQGEIQLHNEQTAHVANWTLEFDFAANITSIWDAKITSHTGNHYVITNAGWNNTLAAGGTVSFGFVASPGNTTAKPVNLKLNGVPLDGTGGPAPVPTLSVGDASVNEGNSGFTDALFTVRLSAASATPVTVQYSTADDTAKAGSDYQTKSGTITFAAGELEKTIAIKVSGDTDVEPNEAFRINLLNANGATLADSQGVGMIQNDDITAPAVGNFQFRILDNWGSGFTGEIAAKNGDSTTVKDWRLEFDYAGAISSIWNASIVSRTGNHYVIKAAEWNKDVAAGASVTFGFTASPANAAVPINFILRSAGTGDPGGNTNRSPVAVNDAVVSTVNQAVIINALSNDSDPDGDSLAVSSFGPAAHGNVVKNPDGTLTYTPNTNYVGSDAFTYVISDGQGGTGTAVVSISIAQRVNWPSQVFAPYVDMTLYPMYDLVAAAQSSGVRFFTLAFIVADPSGKPSWGGYPSYGVGNGEFDAAVRAQLTALRALGGDAMVSFGGASNQELAQVITDVTALKNAYQMVVNTYDLRVIDFDIEGGASADRASIDRRSQAIAALQRDMAAAGRPLEVHFTLPVLPTGLTNDGIYVLQSAIRFGVDISLVNIMAMDYGDSAAPNPSGKMGDYAIQSASSLFAQLRGLYGMTKTEAQVWGMIGVTPMIGLNDVITETFDQQEARELLAFAEQKGIGLLSMWSLNRDRSNPNGQITYVEPTSSSLVQSPLEFSRLFNEFLE